MKSWKTTICAIGCVGIAVLFKFNYIDMQSTMMAITIASALGFSVSKDFNVSGKVKSKEDAKS